MGHNSQFLLLSNQDMVIALSHNLKIFRHFGMNTMLIFLNNIQLLINLCLILIEQREPIVFLDEVLSWDEINISVKQMNNNKALGMDGITAEILKCGGEEMIDLLEQVIHNVWESETPQDWRDAIFVSLHKKRSKSNCGNFRGIFLLSKVVKVFSRIIWID